MADLRQRLAGLEAGGSIVARAAASAPRPIAAREVSSRSDLSTVLALTGRTFMVFGGAFFLRAVTDSGRVPRGVGIAAGLAYAVACLIAADWAAGSERRLSSSFHGGAGVVIGFPLLWEAATRFGLLAPATSAGAVALLAAAALAVAWHRDLAAVAALTMVGAVATAVAFLGASAQPTPFGILLVAVGVGTVWVGEARGWPWLAWLPALAADAAVASLMVRALCSEDAALSGAVVGTQLLLAAAYVGSFVAQILLRGRVVTVFEAVQTLGVLGFGSTGALVVAHAGGGGEALISAASVALAAVAYAGAITSRRTRPEGALSFHYFAGIALALGLMGCLALFRGNALATVLAGAGLGAAWLAHRVGALHLSVHSSVYCTVAAWASGLLALMAAAFVLAPEGAWPSLGWAMWATLAATALAVAMPGSSSPELPPAIVGLPNAMLAFLLVFEVSAIVIATSAPAIAGVPPVAGTLATLRTGVLAGIAVLMALAKRRRQTAALGWLVYPLLGTIAVKLLVEDLRHSEPATLFLALGFFGVALLVTARVMTRRPDA